MAPSAESRDAERLMEDILRRFSFPGAHLALPKGNGNNTGVVTVSGVKVGTPLLVVPLSECWTKARAASECLPVTKALREASTRNPKSELLAADSTWITLHLLHDLRLATEMPNARKAFLALMTNQLETFLSWSDEDTERLRGSMWHKKIIKSQMQVQDDFDTLVMELGPEVVRQLGLKRDKYAIAHEVLQQYGFRFLGADGQARDAIIPGLGLFESAEDVPRDLRIDVSAFGAGATPHVVLHAAKSYGPQEHVKVACAGNYQDQDYVELSLQFPYAEVNHSAVRDLAEELGRAAPLHRPGFRLPQGHIDAVEMRVDGGKQTVQVTLQLTLENPLPSRRGVALLGFCILSDLTSVNMFMDEEQDLPSVLSEGCCEKRAMAMIRKELENMLEACSQAPIMLHTPQGARSKLAARLVVKEKKILQASLADLESRLADSTDGSSNPVLLRSSLTALKRWPTTKEELGLRTEIGRAMATLDLCIYGLNEIAKRFWQCVEHQKFGKNVSDALQSDLVAMHSCAHSSGLGEFSKFPSAGKSGDIVIEKHAEVARAMLRAKRAALEWQATPLLQNRNGLEGKQTSLAAILTELGSTCFCSHQFSEAMGHFQKSLQLAPSTGALRLAEACAMTTCAISESVLAEPASARTHAGVVLLKQRLFAAGFTHANVPVPERLPLSLPEALAAGLSDKGADDFLALVRLFILHRPLSAQRVVKLLGRDITFFLLECSALSFCRGEDFSILTKIDVEELVNGLGRKMSDCLVFANVALQPLEGELLVASDFEYGATHGTVECVPYVAQDTCALIAAAKGTSLASAERQVLDAGCGNGALGIAAFWNLHADKVTFSDANPRALRFAKFNAHINGLGNNARFLPGRLLDSVLSGGLKGSSFDLVISSQMLLPNPAQVITTKGPMFSKGQGEGILSSWGLVSTVLPLIRPKPGACFLVACLTANMETFAQTLEAAYLQEGDMCAKVFHSPPSQLQDCCMKHLSRDTTEVERLAYSQRLQQEGVQNLSQTVLLVMVKPKSPLRPCQDQCLHKDQVEILSERRGLLHDVSYLQHEVEKAKISLFKDLELQQMVMDTSAENELMYDMDWDNDEVSTTASDAEREESGDSTPASASRPWEPKSASQHELLTRFANMHGNKMTDGASWEELLCVSAFGWAPPVNTVSTWRVCPGRQPAPVLPEELPHFAIVELEGVACPSSVMGAFQETFGCQVTFSFNSATKEFTPTQLKRKTRRRLRKDAEEQEQHLLESIDDVGVVLVPFPPGCYADKPIVALPTQALFLFQALAEKARAGLGPSVVVTLSCNAAGPMIDGQSAEVSPAAAINAMSRTVRLEVPQLTLINMDSDMFGASNGAYELAAQVILELGSPDKNMEIAWRGKERWIRALKLSASNPIRGSAAPPLWGWGDAVVLITGGTGGLGIVSAEALVEAGARRIILTSRSGKIQRSGQGLEERLKKMQAMGAEIILDMCDTSSEEQVRECLQRTRERHGPIAAVIHAAGVLADCLLDTQTQETMETSFAAKANGAWYLHKQTLSDKLKAFICFSSTSSLVGNVGQVNYSGANGYMDGLCAMRAHKGLPALALMWPAVADVGMAAAGILAERKFDAHDQVGVDVVKQVIRRCVCEPQPTEPLVAVSPPCITTPKTPQSAWFVEPLYTDYLDKELLVKMKDKGMLGKESGVN